MCANLHVTPTQENPQEPEFYAGHVFYDDALGAVRNMCERLPDRVEPSQGRLWTETVSIIYAIVTDAIERRDGDGA